METQELDQIIINQGKIIECEHLLLKCENEEQRNYLNKRIKILNYIINWYRKTFKDENNQKKYY
jgi:hypothetical protein